MFSSAKYLSIVLLIPTALLAAPAATTQEVQEILHPAATQPAFEEATRAIERYPVATGLKMTVWAAEPQLSNPVCFYPDDKGRIWVCETFRFDGGGPGEGVYDIRHMMDKLDDDLACRTVEDRLATIKKWENNDLTKLTTWPDRIRLLEDKSGDGKCDSSKIFADSDKQPLDGLASGILVRTGAGSRGDDIYFANIPNLWLLRDNDNDGHVDFRQSLSYGYGVRYNLLGHDLHGLKFGPDGKLYFSIGDRGLHVKTREGKIIDNPDSGAVLRCDPDGSNLELFATGLRNPQELAFDQYGNLFSGDNNCDYGDPARWVYIVEGGDTGWRVGYQHQQTPKPTGPWLAENLPGLENEKTPGYIIPPIAHIASGPSGVAYYPGTGFTPEWNGHFLECDCRAGPSSVIHSFAMKPKGAGFELVDSKPFADHIVATDVDFGPDGAAYISDWNSGWVKNAKGRIYKVVSEDGQKDPIVAETKKLLADGFAQRDSAALEKLMAHRDMRVRQNAQFALASRGGASIPNLANVIGKNNTTLPRIHAIWALGQIARKTPQAINLVTPLLADKDEEVRAQAAKIVGEAKDGDSLQKIIKLLADPSPRVRFFAAMACGKIGDEQAVPGLLKLLANTADKDAFLRHAAVMGLAGCTDENRKPLLAAAREENRSVRMGAILALRRHRDADVSVFLNDTDAALVLEAARPINDMPIEKAFADLARLASNAKLQDPALLRALNANFRLGTSENATAVANIAASKDASELMRIEALAMLADWTSPRGTDRVLGIWRPLPKRDSAIAMTAAKPILFSILSSAPDAVRLAAIDLVKKIGVPEGQENLLSSVVTAKDVNPDVAAKALETMETLKDKNLDSAVDAALKNGKAALRRQAITLLAHRPGGVDRLKNFLDTGTLNDQQAVFDAMSGIDPAPEIDKILEPWVEKLAAEPKPALAPELTLDLLEAAGRSKSESIQKKLKVFEGHRSKEDPLAAYTESLVGGDASVGQKIFMEKAETSCFRCHKIEGTGGIAGPDLSAVGARRDRRYILQSILNPNADIAPGFENVTVSLKSGKKYSGMVTGESDDTVVLDAGDGASIHVQKKEINKRTKGLSPMPQDISKPLNKRDLRNLVEYLANRKTPATQPTQPTAATQAAAREAVAK
ncbi:MAG TPA: PVC-type heme-binding CxxCH protein [Tepidisphaeraceae bacterium]